MYKNSSVLFSPLTLGTLQLRNRIVMAPMTRSRAIGNIPNELMVKYYADRSDAGLIITEGASPSPDGLGYARIPGMFSDGQAAAWKRVTDAVHAKGSKIFVQLMHTGRISHPLNLPQSAEVIAPSAIAAAATQMYTDAAGMQPLPVPRALRTDELPDVIHAFVNSARAAISAGFDGVELHGANGYLLDQFLNPGSNRREDAYGGTPDNRNRFVLEVASAVAGAIGAERTGIRVSPFGAFNDMITDEQTGAQYEALAAGLGKLNLAYIHIVDHSSMGTPAVPQSVKDAIRTAFNGTIILSGGYDAARAEADINGGKGDLVAFGRPFIANPDLVKRLTEAAELSEADPATFYTSGEAGYNDYPTASAKRARSILAMFSF